MQHVTAETASHCDACRTTWSGGPCPTCAARRAAEGRDGLPPAAYCAILARTLPDADQLRLARILDALTTENVCLTLTRDPAFEGAREDFALAHLFARRATREAERRGIPWRLFLSFEVVHPLRAGRDQ